MTNDQSDFTQGSILKKLVTFMMPVLGALILQAAYGAVDLLVVGRFGSTSGLSAVSTGSQVLNLVTFVVIQTAMGITVLIARCLGEKKPEQIGSVIGGSAIVFTIISVVLFVVMVGFARPISILMQAPTEAVDLTAIYVRICGAGIFFIVAYNLLSAIFRGLGDSKSPLLFVLVACIINIFGDLALVARLHMDAAGAAIATVAAQACSVGYDPRTYSDFVDTSAICLHYEYSAQREPDHDRSGCAGIHYGGNYSECGIFYMDIQPKAFATELISIIAAKMGQRYWIIK